MENERPIPTPATIPPPGREPERKFLHLRNGYYTSVYIHYPPAGAPEGKLPVLYAHGIQSHPGWFTGSAMALADAGHTVYQLTRRGSGDNTKARGHQPPVGPSAVDDVIRTADFVLQDSGQQRLHLLGVSWGGKLVTAFASGGKKGRETIASLTLVAPGIASKADVPLRTKFAIAACLTLPYLIGIGIFVIHQKSFYRDPLWWIEHGWLTTLLYMLGTAWLILGYFVFSKIRFPLPLNDPALFTDNPAMRTYLANDAFQLHRATARFLFESRLLDRAVRKAKANSISCPTTLILSRRDKIIDNGKTRAVVEKLAGKHLDVVEIDGAHTLEFEPDPSEFYRRVVEAVQRGE